MIMLVNIIFNCLCSFFYFLLTAITIQTLKIVFRVLSMAVALITYQQELRRGLIEKPQLGAGATVVCLLWRTCMVAARIITFSSFAAIVVGRTSLLTDWFHYIKQYMQKKYVIVMHVKGIQKTIVLFSQKVVHLISSLMAYIIVQSENDCNVPFPLFFSRIKTL